MDKLTELEAKILMLESRIGSVESLSSLPKMGIEEAEAEAEAEAIDEGPSLEPSRLEELEDEVKDLAEKVDSLEEDDLAPDRLEDLEEGLKVLGQRVEDTRSGIVGRVSGELEEWRVLNASGGNPLLDGSVHSDTADKDCAAYSIIAGSASSKWDTIAASEGLLRYNSTDKLGWLAASEDYILIGNSDGDWDVLTPSTGVLAYDSTNHVNWITTTDTYKVIQLKADGKIGFDWVRAHS